MSGQDNQRSRLTFRKNIGGTCWQKQLRDKHLDEGTPPVPSLDLKTAVVRPVGRKLAEQIILKYEWLGTLPPFSQHYFGLFFGLYCAGVTCVGIGAGVSANPNMHKEFNLNGIDEMAYLIRGANVHWSPPGANSKLVSWTCKLLARDTKAKLIIAYSDTDAGEIGTIYQACNWAYIGLGASTRQWVAPNGRIYDQKYAYDLSRKQGVTRAVARDALKMAGWREQNSNPKHRYVCILDKGNKPLTRLIESINMPYPKRASEVKPGDTADNQSAKGGSSPTLTLNP